MRRDRYKTSIAFIDLLFNITIGLAMLFIIAFLLINPVAKKGDIIVKAEFIVTMSWPADRHDDIDLYLREVLPGQYIVNAHWYSKSNVTKQLPTGEVYEPSVTVPVTVKIEKLNPYQLVYVGTKTLDFQGAEATFLRFTLDDEGNVVETNDLPFKMANTTGTR